MPTLSKPKKLVLVFPPLTMPTSPPLGAAMLKGFVQRQLPNWQVKVLDLNLWTFQRIFDLLAAGKLPLPPKVFPNVAAARANLLAAAQVFRGGGDHADFYRRPERYETYAALLLLLLNTLAQELMTYCDGYDPQTPLRPLLQELLDQILVEKPDCVGFSMIFTQQLAVGALLGKLLRQRHGLKVLMGGSCFTDTAEDFLRWYPEAADVIVSGEGEDALVGLLRDLNSPQNVPGAIFRRDGIVQKIPASCRGELDFFGRPDFGDVHLRDYFSPEPVIPVLLSRGCYWRRPSCAFSTPMRGPCPTSATMPC